MKIALCATKNTIASIWKEGLSNTNHTKQIILNEEDLLAYLSEYNEEVNLICLEDNWIDKNETELKELIVALQGWYPKLDIMILSQYPTFELGKELLNLGIKGYGNARMLPVHLQDAFDCIQKGDIWVYPEFVQKMIKTINTPQAPLKDEVLDVLTPKEKEVAQYVYQGYSNKEISDLLNITLRTVKAHTTAIYEKLQVKDRIALVLMLKNMDS